ncbi:MAG: glutaminyl-peptide cyclotransferase [Lysobacterales bacterium]
MVKRYRAQATLLACGLLLACTGLAAREPATSAPAPVTQAPTRPAPAAQAPAQPVQMYDYQVVNRYPHDRSAFTQGLLYRDGFLYESTGLNGRSSLRKVVLETGAVIRIQRLDRKYFGEGLADWDGSLIQVTWQAGTGFVYDLDTFQEQRQFQYPGEGWGLTADGTRLIMSDGTPQLRFLDPETLAETGRVDVTYEGQPLRGLNELEFIAGRVYANVFPTQTVVMIDPHSGAVTGRVDLTGLLPDSERGRVDVLNGIAWDADGERVFVTGKLWPTLFEIRLTPRAETPP